MSGFSLSEIRQEHAAINSSCGIVGMTDCDHSDFDNFNEWGKCVNCGIRLEAVCLRCEEREIELTAAADRIEKLGSTIKNIKSAYANIDLNESIIDPSLLFDLTDAIYENPDDYLPRNPKADK